MEAGESPPDPEKGRASCDTGPTPNRNNDVGMMTPHAEQVKRSRTPTPPYCWQSKEALRMIREHLDGDSHLSYALSVYVA